MADSMPLVARIMVEHGGGGPPKGPGMAPKGGGDTGDDPVQKKIKENSDKSLKQGKSQLAKTIGINVGTASILKQSQVFTGFIGTIFQLMGALVDVILAPFLPIMIPAIKLLASFIPIAQNIMAKIFGALKWGFDWIAKGVEKLLSFVPASVKNVGSYIVTGIKYLIMSLLIGAFLLKLVGAGKLANSILGATIGRALRPLQAIYNGISRLVGFGKKKGNAALDKLATDFYNLGMTKNSIYVHDVAGGAAAGKRGNRAARANARNAKGANRAMGGLSTKMGRFASLSGKFQGRNLMRLGGMGILLTGMTGLIGRSFSGLKDTLGKGLGAVQRGISLGTNTLTRLVPQIPRAIDKSKGVISRLLGGAKNAAIATGRFIWGGAVAGFDAVKGGLTVAKNFIADGARKGFNIVKGGLTVAKDGIVDGGRWGYNLVKDGLISAKTFIADRARAGFNTSKDFIARKAGEGFNRVKGGLTDAKTAISDAMGAAKTAITDGLTTAKTFIGDTLGTAKTAVTDGLRTAKTAIGDAIGTAKTAITDTFTTAKTAITDALGTAKTAITDTLGNVKTAVTDKIALGKQWADDAALAIKNSVGTALTTAQNAITDAVGAGKQWATDTADAVGKKLVTLGDNIGGFFDGLATKIGGFFGDIGGLLKKIPGVGKAIEAAKQVKDGVTDAGKWGWNKIKGGLDKITGAGKDAVGGVQDLGEKAAEKTGKSFFERVLGPVKKAAPVLSKAVKLVPGLNVAAEVVMGTYMTVKAFKKYGLTGGLATAGFAATAIGAAAGASLVPGGTIASAAYSVTGYMALEQVLKRTLTERDRGSRESPQQLNLTIVNETGIGTPFEQHQERVQADGNGNITVRTKSQDRMPGGRN